MKFSDFIKKKFYEFSPPLPENPKEELTGMKENTYLNEAVKQYIKSRKDSAKEVFQLLGSDKIKLICIKGPSGTGKTHFLRSIQGLLEKTVLTYYYECPQAANLDDIILSLFNYLKKVTAKDKEYIRNFKISASLSIDERLVNRVKNLEKPLLIFIDGIENIFGTADESTKKDFLNFLDFIFPVPAIKVITAGENFPEMENKKQVYTINLDSLKQEEAFKLMGEAGISASYEVARDIFKITRGYPENILLFSAFADNSNLPCRELADKITSSEIGFEKLIPELVYNSVSPQYKELADFFLLVRHSFSIETLEKINFTPDVGAKIAYLESIRLLSRNSNSFQIKKKFKNYLSSKISGPEKIKIHLWLYKLYSEQISAKLEKRVLPISRRLLYSEQYFHYKKLAELGVIPEYDAKTRRQMEVEDFMAKVDAGSYEDIQPAKDNEQDEEFPGIPDDFTEQDDNPEIELTEDEKALFEEEMQNEEFSESEDTEEKEPEIPEDTINPGESLKTDLKSAESTEKSLKESLMKYREDKLNYNYALFRLANLYKERFHHDQALQGYYSVLNSESSHIPENILLEVLKNTAEIYDYRGDFDSSINYFERALLEAEKYSNTGQKAEIYFKLALAYDDSGDYENALKFYQKNLEISENPEENRFLAAACSNIAAIYDETGNPKKAIEFYKKSLNIDTRANNRDGEYEVLSKLGNIYFETGNYTEAGKCFYKELNIAKHTGDPYKIAMSYIDIGDIFLFEKNYEKAVKAFILAKKSIDKTISTDSREKIDRRFRRVIDEIGRKKYAELLHRIKAKNA